MEAGYELSEMARRFGAKTARSIAEIQQSVNNMADVLVFLEVLGYDEPLVRKNGFLSMRHLADYVYDFVDVYDDKGRISTPIVPIPKSTTRVVEALTMVFPWIGALALLFLTGVSLWMAWGLPLDVTTMFIGGVFLGLILTEGLVQSFQRLCSFYYSQTNIGEVKRSVKRHFAMIGLFLSCATAGIYASSSLAGIPSELATIAVISMVTVAIHRLSFVIMYVMKRFVQIAVAYGGAFLVLIMVYYLLPNLSTDNTSRYFAALGAAFGILSAFSAWNHYKVMGQKSATLVSKRAPHFYSPLTVNDDTISSRFGVQLWESLPIFGYGTFFFLLLFRNKSIMNGVRIVAGVLQYIFLRRFGVLIRVYHPVRV